MSDDILVAAASRTVFGKGASRRLRREDLVPAIVFGADKQPEPLQLKHNEVVKHLDNESFYSQLITLSIDGKEPVRTLLRDVQRHPHRQQILHLDFQRVVAGQALQVTIPLHYLNEDTCYGVKTEGGMINKTGNEVTVSCLPRNIPESIEVDLADLKIGDTVHLSDLVMPADVELVDHVEKGSDSDRTLAAVVASRATTEGDEDSDSEGGAAVAESSD
jgi:large subunit ribosomal protein L25